MADTAQIANTSIDCDSVDRISADVRPLKTVPNLPIKKTSFRPAKAVLLAVGVLVLMLGMVFTAGYSYGTNAAAMTSAGEISADGDCPADGSGSACEACHGLLLGASLGGAGSPGCRVRNQMGCDCSCCTEAATTQQYTSALSLAGLKAQGCEGCVNPAGPALAAAAAPAFGGFAF